jgi:hypothetical protein
MEPNLIPTLDSNPLPAPYWVFKLLLVVTFVLHILAMNFMLGSAILALVAKWRSRNAEKNKRLFLDVAKKLPVLLPVTITLGIAPLLFVQVLYGQFFYTSSIILAWPWFLVLVFLTASYYGFYYVSFKGAQKPGKAGVVMLFSVVLIFLIGFVYSNNVTLSQTPGRWREKYFANPAGWNLDITEPTLFPRFLHFFAAAMALGGLLLVFIALARWKRDTEYARHIFQFGGKAFMYATMAQFPVGIWFLASLPRDLRMLFLGDNALATLLFVIGVGAAIGAILLMAEALRRDSVQLAAYFVSGLTGVVVLSMAVMRDMLRDAYLKPYFRPEQFTVKTQWSVFPLFLFLFVAGVILWFVMLKRYGLFGGAQTPDETSVETPVLTGAAR